MATLSSDPGEASSRHIDIDSGTPEHLWAQCERLHALPAITLCDLVPRHARAVILAPHPDDEALACGGLIHQLAQLGRQVEVVAVSDGEGSHPPESTLSHGLAALRARESSAALRHLHVGQVDIHRVGLPDGAVMAHRTALQHWLRRYLKPTDTVFAPWCLDGHPDHEAVGLAATGLEHDIGCKVVEVPIWAWHWASPGDRRLPWSRGGRLALTPGAEANKRLALQCYLSQIRRDGTRPPVLPAPVLAHFVRPYEVFFL